jgi:hypothetical protein
MTLVVDITRADFLLWFARRRALRFRDRSQEFDQPLPQAINSPRQLKP